MQLIQAHWTAPKSIAGTQYSFTHPKQPLLVYLHVTGVRFTKGKRARFGQMMCGPRLTITYRKVQTMLRCFFCGHKHHFYWLKKKQPFNATLRG